MNHRTQVNTSPKNEQAKSITLPLFQLNALCQQLGDIGEQALTAQTLAEIAFKIIDDMVVTDPAASLEAAKRLDALFKSAYRAAIVIQESAVTISLALEEVEGGVQ